MRPLVKAVAYIGIIGCTAIFAYWFTVEYGQVTGSAANASASRMILYLGAFLVSAIGLGLLCAYDLASLVGETAERFFLEGRMAEKRIPELDEAELTLVKGKALDAIHLMRD